MGAIQQFFVIVLISSAIIYYSNYLSCFVSFCGKTIIILLLSWMTTNFIQRFKKKEYLNPSGKAVLITGCDSGFGNLLALKLNEYGFRVYATVYDPSNSGSQQLVKNSRFSNFMKVIKIDVTNDEEVNNAYEDVKKDVESNGDQLWAVVNNASIMTAGLTEWGTLDTYKQVFEVNVFGLVRVTRIFLPLIRKSKGRIVNMGSILSRYTVELLATYCMSKHAVISFSDALRREIHKWGVKVSTIEPGAFKTGMTSEESISKSLDKSWAETSDKVKKDYGHKYFESQKQFMSKTLKKLPLEDRYELVVNDMFEAIANVKPEITYRPIGGIYNRIIYTLGLYIPNQCFDKLTYFFNPSQPGIQE